MKKIKTAVVLMASTVLFSCGSSHSKRILVYASSDIKVDASQKNITVTEGTTHHEKVLDFPGSGTITLNVESPTGKYSLEATDDGLYIANLKPDTLVGSYQQVGTDNGTVKITPERKEAMIDSLEKLVNGSNISAANKNYFIKPHSMVWITKTVNAKIFGPFTTIPSGFDASTVPEIYKFYKVDDERAIIENLKKLGELNYGK